MAIYGKADGKQETLIKPKEYGAVFLLDLRANKW
jgi:hypothetical protein